MEKKAIIFACGLALTNQNGGIYERKRSYQCRYFHGDLFCYHVHSGNARIYPDIPAAACGHCADTRRHTLYAVSHKSKAVRHDMDHERHHGTYDDAHGHELAALCCVYSDGSAGRACLQKRKL